MLMTPVLALYVAAPAVPVVVSEIAERAPNWLTKFDGLDALYGVNPRAPVTWPPVTPVRNPDGLPEIGYASVIPYPARVVGLLRIWLTPAAAAQSLLT